MKMKQLLLLITAAILGGYSHAAEVSLTPADLSSKWVWGVKQDCGSGAIQYVTFQDNGTLEVGKGTVPGAVGFWSLKDNDLSVHLLVAPSESDDSNVFYKGRYTYSYVTAEVLEASESSIEIITGTTGNTKRSTLSKCE